MMEWANWLSPATMRVLALTLLHFMWQGATLAALVYVLISLCRSASTRYAVGVGVLVLMLAAPITSFFVLREQSGHAVFIPAADAGPSAKPATLGAAAPGPLPLRQENGTPYFLWLVEAWFAGVVLLSLRSIGGIVVVERLRRAECTPLARELEELCVSLQRRMGLERVVRYCESIRLDAPAVAGWIRPVVLLPAAAISGLSTEQLEAVIAHELAHIRRHDAFVQLFQVAVETLLFYHPAVWWLGKRIRAERENCCDDVAVALCGSPVAYAHALTRMAEWNTAPQLALAANGGAMVERIARLLGAKRPAETLRTANLWACALCVLTALLAGSAFLGNVRHVQAQTPAPSSVAKPEPEANSTEAAPAARPAPREYVIRPQDADSSSPATSASPAEPGPSAAPQNTPAPTKSSYIDSLKDAGLDNLSVDQLIALKVQGVTGEYVKAMRDLGLTTDVNQIIGMKVQGITPEYVKQMREATGEKWDTGELIGMKVQGVTPEYVRQMKDLGLQTDSGKIIGLKVQGITPEYVREMKALGLKTNTDSLIGMKVQGVAPEYVKNIQSLGFHPDSNEIIGMKVQGVDAAYIKGLEDAGFKVDVRDAIGAKVQGVTPEFIAKVRSHGFKDLTLSKVIQLKVTGVFDDER